MSSIDHLVRACYRAYETKDRNSIEALLADDFTFSSPVDDNIDRARYFDRCWPNSEHLESFAIEKLLVDGDEAIVRYRATASDEAGNTAVDTQTSTKSAVAITTITSPINASNDDNTSVSGTGQAGATPVPRRSR